MPTDIVNSPSHYSWIEDVECLEVAANFNFCCGNVIKYVWRHGKKGSEQDALDDLRKASFYLNREIERRISEDRQSKAQWVDGKELKK